MAGATRAKTAATRIGSSLHLPRAAAGRTEPRILFETPASLRASAVLLRFEIFTDG